MIDDTYFQWTAETFDPARIFEKPEALQGVRVVELGTLILGPCTSDYLGEFGAEVIKVELPPTGDTMRYVPPDGYYWENLCLGFMTENHNKHHVGIDLHVEEGRELFRRLVQRADVVVENLRAGTLDRWKLGYRQLSRLNPRLVYLAANGFGQWGPYTVGRASYDLLAQAMSGLAAITGFAGRPPMKSGTYIGDFFGSLLNAVSILAALHWRERTGKGQFIEFAQSEGLIRALDWTWVYHHLTGGKRERYGNRDVVGDARADQVAGTPGRLPQSIRLLFPARPHSPRDPRPRGARRDRQVGGAARRGASTVVEAGRGRGAPRAGRLREAAMAVEEGLPVGPGMDEDIEWEAWIRERDDPRRSQGKPEALEGLVVLDLSTSSIAGVFCSSLLAELGAEVIRIEPPGGDVVRRFTPFGVEHLGTGLGYLVEGRNKLHVTLDLEGDRGREILRRLARRADVLVETFRPGEADAMGIGYRQLAPRNPRLVYAAISTYGQWGPEASRQRAKRDREVADQALAGIVHITGERPPGPDPKPHEVPTKAGAWLGWYAGGAWAAFGVLAALRWRERNGHVQMVDVSGAEAIMRWMEDMVAYYQRAGVLRERLGLLDTSVSPYTFVPTRDGHAMIAGFSDVNFTAPTTIMGKEHLRQDPRFTTFVDRLKPESRKVLYAEVAEWSKERTSQEILSKVNEYVLGKKGPGIVATGRVNRPEDTLADENWWIRGALQKMEDPVYGELVIQGPAVKMTESPPRVKWVCRPPGADNGYVYLKYLGLGRSQLEELGAEGVV